MQAPPAFSLTVTRFGAWRAACWALAAVSFGSAAAWAWGPAVAPPGAALLPWAALGLGAWACRPPRPCRLVWDTRTWSVDGRPGSLAVMVDLGAWLLLRFVPADGRGPARHLPVQRHGHATAWHALRCTVHGARPPAEDRLVEPA